MANSSRTIMTDAGFALETRVRADETKMQFTRAAISTDDHFSDTDDALAKLTELSNIQQDGKVTAVQVINTTTVYVQVDVNQAESKDDYQMRSAALYAKDDDGTEVLYGVTVLQDPVFVHKDADGSYLGFGINTTVGKASNVVVVVDPANMVTQQIFEGTMKNYYTKAEVDAKFVTDDDFASKLPKNIATTDAANTFSKSQTLAGGATDGKGNAYATTKDVATGLNNGLSTKVTDNKNGTEQLNGVQVQPYNMLTDTIGGRNYALDTGIPITVSPSNDWKKLFVAEFSENLNGQDSVVSFDLMVDAATTGQVDDQTGTDTNPAWFSATLSSNQIQGIKQNGFIQLGTLTPNVPVRFAYKVKMPVWADTTKTGSVPFILATMKVVGGNVTISKFKIEKGTVATDWTPAPEDKVNVTDMRKPASDVAGIEEVAAKQDKIGYTPANDSKVAHLSGANNFDTVPTVNNNPLLLASSLPSDLARTGSDQEFTGKNTFDVAPIDKATGNPYITAKAPGIPKLAVKYNATSKAFDYTLTAPEKDGLSDIIQYNLLWKDHSVDDWTTVIVKPDALTGQLTGVDITKTYDFKAAAQNAVGSSDSTDVITLGTMDDRIFGASWDMSSDPKLTRTDAAVGLVAGINGAQNDFDTVGPWAKMDKTITDDKGNSFVRIPKLYIKKTQTDKLATWQVSLSKIDDSWYLPKCFWDFTNQKELDYVDVGRYQGTVTGGLLQSKSGVTATASLTIGSFRADAKANGDGYQLLDIHVVDVWQVLFIVEFATLSSQSIMPGNLDNRANGSAKTNGTGSNHAGSSGYATSTGPMDYRGIENMYGNLYQWVDGVNITSYKAWVCDDSSKYQSDLFAAPYQALNYTYSANGYISKMGYDPSHPFAQFATAVGGSDSAYYSDYQYTNSGNVSVLYGGGWNGTAGNGGAFHWLLGNAASGSYTNVGSRLVRKALS